MDARFRARDLIATSEISLTWLSYFSVGGNAGPFEMEAFIYGIDVLDQTELGRSQPDRRPAGTVQRPVRASIRAVPGSAGRGFGPSQVA